ncbi:MAG TPA: hypothetical protein VEC37_19290 [Bacillota bacterium]|nr:hypothetical protein [Bacillota bacterium]
MGNFDNWRKGQFVFWLTVMVMLVSGIVPIWAKTESQTELQIKKIDYLVENIPSSVFGEDKRIPSLFFSIFIYIDDLRTQLSQIKRVYIVNKYDTEWELNLRKHVDLEEGYLGGYMRLFDELLSQNGSLLAIKDMKVVVELRNGKQIKKTFSIPTPGNLKPSSRVEFFYSPKYRGKRSETHIPVLQSGVIKNLEAVDHKFKCTFTVKDERITNGHIIFYDKKQNYLGQSLSFVNRLIDENADFVNEGVKFHTNGQLNAVSLSPSDIRMLNHKKYQK